MPTFSPTAETIMNISTASAMATAVPSPTHNIIIKADDLLSIPGLKILDTPTSKYYCEHMPPPQVIQTNDKFSVRAGRFSLCPSISWPLVKTAIDLDTGILVSADDPSGDLSMEYAHPGLNGEISYGVLGLNSAHIDEAETNGLSYAYCENILKLLDTSDPGVLNVHEKAVACVITTEHQIAIVRVENIYPLDTQAVEFSYAILKKQ
jgi:hypothetical protein